MKFIVSQFKNATPNFPKKDVTINELQIKTLENRSGLNVSTNGDIIAFNMGCGDLGLVSYKDISLRNQSIYKFSASREFINSFHFSHLDSTIIASCSYQEPPKIWKISNNPLSSKLIQTISDIPDNKFENISFHPSCKEILGIVSENGIYVADINSGLHKYKVENQRGFTCLNWKSDGSLICCCEKNGNPMISDIRTGKSSNKSEIMIKDCRIIWAGMSDNIITCGSENIGRFIYLWDIRSFNNPVIKMDIDTSQSSLFPIYDIDTNIIILGSRGENSFYFTELENQNFTKFRSDRSDNCTIGLGSFPKLSLNVMACEVVRTVQLTKSSLIPIPYNVPRKSYSTFYDSLFPETYNNESNLKLDEWMNGINKEMDKKSLDPTKNDSNIHIQVSKSENIITSNISLNSGIITDESCVSECETYNSPGFLRNPELYSKFRHVQTVKFHKSSQHEMINNIGQQTSSEGRGFDAIFDNIAIPLNGEGGRVGIIKISQPGRIPSSGAFFVENGSAVNDLALDPHNDNLLAVICEDCAVHIWKIPSAGLNENTKNESAKLSGHSDRATLLSFHPFVGGMLASGSIDGSVRIWDIQNEKCISTCLEKEGSQILAMDFPLDESLLYCVTAKKQACVFDPRANSKYTLLGASSSGAGPSRVKSIDKNRIFLSGFNENGNRRIQLKDLRKFSADIATIDLDCSPSVLVPHYDEDTKLVYLSGRGDTSICVYEVRDDSVGLFECPKYCTTDIHRGYSILRKDLCDVKNVEIARCVRLMNNSTEIVSFRVPRVKCDYFQDDLFPNTRVIWEPSMTCSEWLSNKNIKQKFLDLKPKDMTPISQAKVDNVKTKKYDSSKELEAAKKKMETKVEGDFLGNVMDKIGNVEEKPSPQESMQGIDESEWDD